VDSFRPSPSDSVFPYCDRAGLLPSDSDYPHPTRHSPLAYFPACFAAISKLTSLSERSMMTGVILSIGVVFGMGMTAFVLGVTADHFNFQTAIFGLGVLVTLSPLAARLLEEK